MLKAAEILSKIIVFIKYSILYTSDVPKLRQHTVESHCWHCIGYRCHRRGCSLCIRECIQKAIGRRSTRKVIPFKFTTLWSFVNYFHFIRFFLNCRWKRVGKVSDLNMYPVKSCAAIKEQTFECGVLGLQHGVFHDRIMMIVNLKGQSVTARIKPIVAVIHSKIDGNRLTLSAPDREDIVIDVEELKTKPKSKSVVWTDAVDSIDAGDEVAEWISQFVLGAKDGLRLVFYATTVPTRPVTKSFPVYKKLLDSDAGAMHFLSSYMLINQASIDDLNTRLDRAVPTIQFRPNIVVEGAKAYDEDEWDWIRIGEKLIFRNLKPCTR